MKLLSVKAKNFFCVGDEPLDIDFTKLGNIVVVKGQNLDIDNNSDAADNEHFSNGGGKSTCFEAVVYGLYGKCIRNKVSHGDVINAINKKKLEVEVTFSKNNIEYRVVRKRKPDSLELWQDDLDVTLGKGPQATQKQIESIIGLNHKAFVNMVCFGQHNSYNFLDCELAEQRSIIESILSLEVYKTYSDTAKDELKERKQVLKDRISDYEKLRDSQSACEQRIFKMESKQTDWRNECESMLLSLRASLNSLQQQLAASSVGKEILAYQQAQSEISDIKKRLPELNARREEITASLTPAKEKLEALKVKRHEILLDIKSAEKKVSDLKDTIRGYESEIEHMTHLKDGVRCDHCFGQINPQNYKHVIELRKNNVESNSAKIEETLRIVQLKNSEISTLDSGIDKLKQLIQVADSKIGTVERDILQKQSRMSELSSVKLPDADSEQMVLKTKIVNLQEKIAAKVIELEGGGPYRDMLIAAGSELGAIQEKCTTCKQQIQEVEKLIPYYEFWVRGFGDEGIRSFIIEGITPALNSRIAYWLQFLINGKLKVKFDKELNPTIERVPDNGDIYAYAATCGGERRRIDLAISQGFAHVLTLSSGTRPSAVFLDEVASNIDKRGLHGVFKMICELAKEKQVFVVSHDQTLLDMLDGADIITMRKQGGFSKRLPLEGAIHCKATMTATVT
jgi:DNA repair exonuclease SbcCD ATPase subunit